MKLKVKPHFATLIAHGSLSQSTALNRQMLQEIEDLSLQDRMGRDWSKTNYPGGYTSYASLTDLHFRARSFSRFSELMQPHGEAFAKDQDWAIRGLKLEMTDCWMNIMPEHAHHSLHLHPHSVISGVYYVTAPKNSSPLRIEDPRMGLYMNAPSRIKTPLFLEIPAIAGHFILFESWLRHEVLPNRSKQPRVSLSFNYSISSP